MRVPTGIDCGKCGKEIEQDRTGNMYCQCGIKLKWIAFGNHDTQ